MITIQLNSVEAQLETGDTVSELIKKYGNNKLYFPIPGKAGLAVVNGKILDLYEKEKQILNDGDVVVITRPLTGG